MRTTECGPVFASDAQGYDAPTAGAWGARRSERAAPPTGTRGARRVDQGRRPRADAQGGGACGASHPARASPNSGERGVRACGARRPAPRTRLTRRRGLCSTAALRWRCGAAGPCAARWTSGRASVWGEPPCACLHADRRTRQDPHGLVDVSRRLDGAARPRQGQRAPAAPAQASPVMVAEVEPSFIWTGPHEVVRCLSEHRYEIKDLVTGKTATVHASRLEYYDGAVAHR